MYLLSQKWIKIIVGLAMSVLLSLGMGAFISLPATGAYEQLKWVFIILVSISAFSLGNMLFEIKAWKYWKNFMAIIIVTLISHWNMLTQPFLYYDDFWTFSGNSERLVDVGVNALRPFIGFSMAFFGNITYSETIYIRWYTTAICAILFSVIFLWLVWIKITPNKATILCMIGASSIWILDATGYAAVLPVLPALTLSVLGFFLFEKGYEAFEQLNMTRGAFLMTGAFTSLLSAFCFYQIATPIIFTLLFIRSVMLQPPIKKYIKYLVICAIWFLACAVGYILLSRYFLMTFQLPGILSRAAVITAPEQILQKAYWFIATVLPQSAWRAWTSLAGTGFLRGNNLFYVTQPENMVIGVFLLLLMVICLGIMIYWIWKKTKNIFYPVISILYIPASFFPFLILPESTYLSYYAIPLIFLLLFAVCGAISLFIRTFTKKTAIPIASKILKPMMIVYCTFVLINALSYSHLGWIKYNQTSFEHIRNTLSVQLMQPENNRIHVLGKMVPYCVVEYSKMAVEQALLELGYNASDYEITASENEKYLLSMTGDDVKKLLSELDDGNQGIIDEFYERSEYYNMYYMRPEMMADERLEQLSDLFKQTELIPDEESCVLIDLRFMETQYVF